MQTPLQGAFRCGWMQNRVFLLMWRGVLSFSFEVRVRQGRVTLLCKSLRGVRAPNTVPESTGAKERSPSKPNSVRHSV